MPFDLDAVQKHVPDVLHRAYETPQIPPRAHDPNPNPPAGSVGPQSSPGALMPLPAPNPPMPATAPAPHAEAWDGWPDDWDTPWLEAMSGGDWSGYGYGRHNPDGYMGRVSTVMTCIDLNSSQLAAMPVYGVRGLETVALPMWAHNPEPEIYADWSDFVMALANSLQHTGDGIIWATARYADGTPQRFVALDPTNVDIEPDGMGGHRYMLAGTELDGDDVCHIRYQVIAGRTSGVGPLEWLGSHLTSVAALQAYAADIARHGVWAVLKHPANLNAKQRNDAKAAWRAGRANAGADPAVLSGGFELETLTLSPQDMALLDLRTMDEQRICAAFRVPPYLVGVDQPGSLTYANASSLTDHHWRSGLRPFAKKIATALSSWALPYGTRLEFDRDEYIRPGPTDRAAYYATLAGIEQDGRRAITVDEVRIAERLRPKTPAPAGEGSADVLIGANP